MALTGLKLKGLLILASDDVLEEVASIGIGPLLGLQLLLLLDGSQYCQYLCQLYGMVMRDMLREDCCWGGFIFLHFRLGIQLQVPEQLGTQPRNDLIALVPADFIGEVERLFGALAHGIQYDTSKHQTSLKTAITHHQDMNQSDNIMIISPIYDTVRVVNSFPIQQKLYHYKQMKGQQDETLEKYNYRKDKPAFTGNNYTVWHGLQNDTNLPVTIKLLKYPHIELPKYLKKLKDVKSDFVVKVFEVVADQSAILFITEQVTYGSLKKALAGCEHLDENDSAFVARCLLNGHVDMLRADCNWFGTEDDIEFTDTGIKLSWNNSCQFNLANPFPVILPKLTARNQAKGGTLLPFPEVKAVAELVKVSKENASQISLHPQMKTKVRFSKRKGKDWMGLKEVKSKNEYFDQLTFLAVSKQFGFVRAKIYQQGKVSPNLLQLNKTKTTFTKVLDLYDEGDKTVILSEYSNDGSLQNYVKRLKAAGQSLKEQHIQFFFYSLFQPLKQVQQSTLKSISMLHIKNIYIQNGIPKIGEPIPLNQRIQEMLTDRADVPDFYHVNFKKDPNSHDVSYDTYSLGVLLYKLMYTEYPIFPSGKVHIPTTPNYNKRLKTSLEIFLNEGGSLSQLESKIEVSEDVLKQVKSNKEKLMEGFGDNKKKVVRVQNEDQASQQDKAETLSKISIVQQEKKEEQVSESDSDDQDGCANMLLARLRLKPAQKMKQTRAFLDTLHQSPYKRCRLWTKVVFTLILYIFMFLYAFINNNVALLANQNILQSITVTASGTTYNVTTSNYYSLQNQYGSLPQTIASLQGLGCLIDGYQGGPVYSSTAYNNSTTWIVFLICSLASMVLILILKAFQINYFDEIRALSFRQNGKGKFNLTNFILLNLIWQTLLAGHFYFFNFVYYGQTQPCLGFANGVEYGSSDALFQQGSNKSFTNIYMAVFISQLVFTIVFMIVMACNESINYNKVLNPITTFGVGLFIFVLIFRFGAIFKTYYYPSAGNDPTGIIKGIFKRGDLVGILGVFPELLLLIEFCLAIVTDWAFWGLVDKSHSLLNNDGSVVNDGLDELV